MSNFIGNNFMQTKNIFDFYDKNITRQNKLKR